MSPVSDGGSESARLHGAARELAAFRSRLHGCIGQRTDALFDAFGRRGVFRQR